eukprot:1174114-Lingulodinium_polyedra.AAC.1
MAPAPSPPGGGGGELRSVTPISIPSFSAQNSASTWFSSASPSRAFLTTARTGGAANKLWPSE